MDIKHKKEDGRSAERVKFFAAQNFNLIQENAYFQGFSGIRTKKNGGLVYLQAAVYLVEVTGFEPATFWSRTKRATKLRYTSIEKKLEPIKGLEPLTCGLRNRCSTN